MLRGWPLFAILFHQFCSAKVNLCERNEENRDKIQKEWLTPLRQVLGNQSLDARENLCGKISGARIGTVSPHYSLFPFRMPVGPYKNIFSIVSSFIQYHLQGAKKFVKPKNAPYILPLFSGRDNPAQLMPNKVFEETDTGHRFSVFFRNS